MSTIIIEHWILVRKSPQGKLADNYRKWGTGFLNVVDEQGKTLTNLLRFPRITAKERAGNPHPTPKPISLMCAFVKMLNPNRGIVLDPFAGSGTTAAACQMEGISSVSIEVNPTFADYARVRTQIPKLPF